MEQPGKKFAKTLVGVNLAALAAGTAFTIVNDLLAGITAFAATLILSAALVHEKHS